MSDKIMEYNSSVQAIALEARELINKRLTEKYDDGKVRFMLIGRITMWIFQHHFGLAFQAAERAQTELEKPAPQEKGTG